MGRNRLSEEKIDKIWEMANKGYKSPYISKEMGITPSTVLSYLKTT